MITRGPASARSFAEGSVLLNVHFHAEAGGFMIVAAMFVKFVVGAGRLRLRAWVVDCVESPNDVTL